MAIHSTEMSRHDKSKTDKTHLNAFDIQRIRFNNKKKIIETSSKQIIFQRDSYSQTESSKLFIKYNFFLSNFIISIYHNWKSLY